MLSLLKSQPLLVQTGIVRNVFHNVSATLMVWNNSKQVPHLDNYTCQHINNLRNNISKNIHIHEIRI